jgi:HD superfamily phosphohydrolase
MLKHHIIYIKNFITRNLKIKGNTPYLILLLESSLSPIESMVMTRYLMYKNRLNNMEDKRLCKIASKSSHNHHRLKQGWHKDAWSWIN